MSAGCQVTRGYLVDYLDAVDEIRCLSEIFHPSEIMLRHHQTIDPRLLDKSLGDADPVGYRERLKQEIGDRPWFGFKHFPRHSLPLLHHLCASREWRKIFLWRDNLIEQYLSFLLASVHFGQATWGRGPDQIQMQVPLALLMDDLHTIQENHFAIEKSLLLAHADDVFTLEYEELGKATVMRGLLHFLGLPPPSIDRTLARAGDGGPRDDLRFARVPTPAQRIRNYPEIRRLLQGSRYQRWLEP